MSLACVGVLTVFGPHWVCPTGSVHAFPAYTAQPPGCSGGNCLKWTLGRMHFPGLSHSGSGSQVLRKGADAAGPAFCALPRSEHAGDQVLGQHTPPGGRFILAPSLVPAAQVPGCAGGAVSGKPRVSSGELISGCDPPGGCQPSRIPGRLG